MLGAESVRHRRTAALSWSYLGSAYCCRTASAYRRNGIRHHSRRCLGADWLCRSAAHNTSTGANGNSKRQLIEQERKLKHFAQTGVKQAVKGAKRLSYGFSVSCFRRCLCIIIYPKMEQQPKMKNALKLKLKLCKRKRQ